MLTLLVPGGLPMLRKLVFHQELIQGGHGLGGILNQTLSCVGSWVLILNILSDLDATRHWYFLWHQTLLCVDY